MLHVEWYHICWPRLTAKRVEPVVSISWASCFWSETCLVLRPTVSDHITAMRRHCCSSVRTSVYPFCPVWACNYRKFFFSATVWIMSTSTYWSSMSIKSPVCTTTTQDVYDQRLLHQTKAHSPCVFVACTSGSSRGLTNVGAMFDTKGDHDPYFYSPSLYAV